MTALRIASPLQSCLISILFVTAPPLLNAQDTSSDTDLTTPVPTDESAADSSGDAEIAFNDEGATEHPLMPAVRVAQASLSALAGCASYEAQLIKRERIEGRLITHVMQMKFRESPLAIYLSYGGSQAGREILFVQGANGHEMWAHEGTGLRALVGTVALAPDSPEALQENRYPITTLGLRNMLESIIEQWTLEARYGEIEVKYYPQAKLNGRFCRVIEASHPRPRKQFRFQMTRLFIEADTQLPVRVEQYGFPSEADPSGPLEEEYTYSDIRTNVQFTDKDFSRDNPEYHF